MDQKSTYTPSRTLRKILLTVGILALFLTMFAQSAVAGRSALYWPGGTKLDASYNAGEFAIAWDPAVGEVVYYHITVYSKSGELVMEDWTIPTVQCDFIEVPCSGTYTVYITAYDGTNTATLKARLKAP